MTAHPPSEPSLHEHEPAQGRGELIRIGLVGLAVLASWLRLWQYVAPVDLIALLTTACGGLPIYREAWAALRARRMTMELSMTIALVAAIAIGELFTAAVIVFFVLIAEWIESLTVARGRHAIHDLLTLLPPTAIVRRGTQETTVPLQQLQLGDIVLIKPGSRIPVDGTVVGGHSHVDQATITGESMPVAKHPGDDVFAGTMNQGGTLEVETRQIGHDTAFGRIVTTVEQAEATRAPIQRIADRLSGYLVSFAFGAAFITFLITHDVRATISVILVAGACGVAAGTPLAILGAIGRAARHGVIIKGGVYLEALRNIQTVVLDKTGTITFGTPTVIRVQPYGDAGATQVLAVAAGLEQYSEHPLARAIVQRTRDDGIVLAPATDFHSTPGRGVTGSVEHAAAVVGTRQHLADHAIAVEDDHIDITPHSHVWVAHAGHFIGTIEIADDVRPDAIDAIQQLRHLSVRPVLLTGDTPQIARAVANQVGIDEVHADLLPAHKAEHVRTLRDRGARVAAIGDGVNDAPALVAATVGVAMGSGTDVARESADIVLIGNDLTKFALTVRLARRCHRIVMANFFGTIGVDLLGMALAATGHLTPLLAVLIHVGSELAFILNSARLIPWKRTHVA
ncbi:MAG: cadmium-translocating P-type ATPase [Deltaproteobacteria bacterium]|nr:cadmium-translocating P-type ATPase [Deltaproteobacteria bacterium]